VVAGRSGGSPEAVVDGATGFVVPPRDVGAVRGAIRSLLEDDGLRRRMGGAARARVEQEHSYDVLVEKIAPLARGDFASLDAFGD
jgi:phosphatidylinositol alpha-1,6-mannosyltransferase